MGEADSTDRTDGTVGGFGGTGDGAASATARTFRRVAIVGCGLIGGSLALAARQVPGVEEIVVTDLDPVVRDAARTGGIGTHVAEDARAAVEGADLVVVATPVDTVVDVARECARWMPIHAVLTDVASVKSTLMVALQEALGGRGSLIGGHPMAGSEESGLAAADGSIFQGATYLLTPPVDVDPDAFRALTAFVRALGCRVLAVAPERHDDLVASVSHLPQLLASTLMAYASDEAVRDPSVLQVAAGGFRDVTRVAASDPDLWDSVLRRNRPAVLRSLDAYLARLVGVRDALHDEDWTSLRAMLTDARAARRALPVKGTAGVLVDVVVPLDDRPGVLSQVTHALGEAAINVEDLSMRHASDGTRGSLVVAVSGQDTAAMAATLLRDAGFAPHIEIR